MNGLQNNGGGERAREVLPGYAFQKWLGQGASGTVCLCKLMDSALRPEEQSTTAASREVVVKLMRLDDQPALFWKRACNEVETLWSLDHQGIARFREVSPTIWNNVSCLAIAMEYAAGGELWRRATEQVITLEDAQKIFSQLVDVLSYLHNKGIAHRDLKLENVLLDGEGNVKVCDFGLSKSEQGTAARTYAVGTEMYHAPETLEVSGFRPVEGRFVGPEYDPKKVDLWCLGVILYIMLYKQYPFGFASRDMPRHVVFSNIRNLVFHGPDPRQDVRTPAELCARLLVLQPEGRMRLEDLLLHSWVLGMGFEQGARQRSKALPPKQTYEQTKRVLEEIADLANNMERRQGENCWDDNSGLDYDVDNIEADDFVEMEDFDD